MTKLNWVLLKTIHNPAEAEVLRGLLEAQGIEVLLAQEGAAKAIGLSMGSLGEIQMHVRSDDENKAQALLSEFFAADN